MNERKTIVFGLLFIVVLMVTGCPSPGDKVWVDRVMLAYRNEEFPTVHFQFWNGSGWSREGMRNVHDTEGGERTTLHNGGVGLASSLEGMTTVLGSWIGESLHFRMGLGPGLFPVYPPDDTIEQGIGSAPSITNVKGDDWLVAYKSDETSRVVLNTYNIGDRGGINQNLNLLADLYDRVSLGSVNGRPALLYDDGKIILFWLRSEYSELRYLIADYEIGRSYLVLEHDGVFSKPADEKYGTNADPAIAFDGSKYYLGFVRRPITVSEGLRYETLYIFTSEDGIEWTEFQPIPPLTMPQWSSNISLAATENGEIFVAVRNSGGKSKGYHYIDGSWTEFTENELFPLDRNSTSTESFSLIRYKVLVDAE